jgi:hypothetical protein
MLIGDLFQTNDGYVTQFGPYLARIDWQELMTIQQCKDVESASLELKSSP